MKLWYWFLALVPAAVIAHVLDAPSAVTFCLAAGALIPLSGLLGEATKELASHFGDSVGGLMNATLGNLAEIIIVVVAVRAGEVELVKASIVGSVIGNLLFILGLSVFVGGLRSGGLRGGTFSFNSELVIPSVTALVFAIVALLAPTIAHHSELGSAIEHRTGAVAIILATIYALLIVFRFTTLKQHAVSVTAIHEAVGRGWSKMTASVVLTVVALTIGGLSEVLVHHVEHATTALKLSPLFVGLFVIPLVGNVAEHFVAVQAAWQRRFDLAIGIALDSATQVALLVTPVAILAAAIAGVPFTLVLPPIALEALVMAVGLVWFVVWDGKSNWWEGAALLLLDALFLCLAF